MAFLYRRRDGRREIRESRVTPQGPRSFTLASFQGPLTDEVLERAEAAARRPFDRAALRERARERGIGVREARADADARSLIARLRRGEPLDPVLATLLREQLDEVPSAPVPETLADAADWIGAGEVERGRALRDVLRLYGAIADARDPVREPPPTRLPRFASKSERDAS